MHDRFSFDMSKFQSYAKENIERVMEIDARNGNQYPIGDNILIIEFSINDKGIPEKFSRISGWGDEFVGPLSNVISRFSKFPPNSGKLYFHLIMSVDNGNTVGYHYNF